MEQLSTEVIKAKLKEQGYENAKRLSKKKDSEGNVVRVFSCSSDTVVVTSNSNDNTILSIQPQVDSLSESSLVPLIPFPLSKMKSYVKELRPSLQLSFETTDLVEILGIPAVQLGYGRGFIDDRIMCFLLVYKHKKMILNIDDYQGFHIQDFNPNDHILHKSLKGIYINTDFELTDPRFHKQLFIPKHSLGLLNRHGVKAIFLSSDLSHGITTSSNMDHGEVCSDKPFIINCPCASPNLDSLEEWVELNSSLKKKYKAYDFITYHM